LSMQGVARVELKEAEPLLGVVKEAEPLLGVVKVKEVTDPQGVSGLPRRRGRMPQHARCLLMCASPQRRGQWAAAAAAAASAVESG
jgi:hypothetical protein